MKYLRIVLEVENLTPDLEVRVTNFVRAQRDVKDVHYGFAYDGLTEALCAPEEPRG